MSNWEGEAKLLGYQGEKEMWEDLYLNKQMSFSQIAAKFHKGINTVRARIDYFRIDKRTRGGANNVKTIIGADLINDIVELGVNKAAKKHGMNAPALYQRLYYKHGTTVRELKEKAKAALKKEEEQSLTECDNVPPSSEE